MAANKVLILGSKGMLGCALLDMYGSQAVGWDKEESDVTAFENLKEKIGNFGPSAVINCAAYNNVDGAEDNREIAFKLNADVPGQLAQICSGLDIPLVHFSTNYVFDGIKGEYYESDEPNPQSVYAKSKYQGEQEVIGNCKRYYLIRTSVIFGPKGQSESSKKSFVELMLDKAKQDGPIKAVNDSINSLTFSLDLAANVKLLLDKHLPFGIYHITNSGEASWYDFAKEIFAINNLNINLQPVSIADFPRKAEVPKKAVLLNTKLPPLRPWQEALNDYLNAD